jgi:AcrR family transcriptional regulator
MPRPPRTTRDKILDAAERLFARRGFYGVSIRDITAAAGVDVALVNYHFGRKLELFGAVLERRAAILNELRLERLEECRRRAAPKLPTVEDIVDAFTQPLLERSARGGAGWKSYFALIAQINNSAEFGASMMTRHFDALVQHFMQALREVLPGSDERDLYWSYHFLTGALTLTFAETGRIDNLSGGVCRSNDLESVHERLVPFIAAGFRELCASPGARAGRVRKHRLAKRPERTARAGRAAAVPAR